ncbi:Hypothetical predicted protein [Lecanosticta acicola]|uniref:YWTD domain-containing protein n=1 Tax=Lecanosticta acicola TaxID=111012 RepID=A0AAI8YT31_9PEZI|nr:Hypothetical predicted protein [Lecanosticta acicola]
MALYNRLYFLSIYHAKPSVPLSEQSWEDMTHRGSISYLDLETPTKAPRTILEGLYMPDGIAISKSQGLIFWTNMGTPGKNDGSIHCARLDGSEARSLLPPGAINTPKQIVLDEEAETLYFCDREGMRVHRCKVDGSAHEILIQTGDWRVEEERRDATRWCVGIAVSKTLGKIFWTQKGGPKSGAGRIFSANIELSAGAAAASRPDVEVVAERLPEPIDLEMDEGSGVLYWTDRGEFPFGNTLNRKHLVDHAVDSGPAAEEILGREIIAEGFGEAIGLALDRQGGWVWVADLCGRIWKCDANQPGAKEKVYEDETSLLTGLALL